MNNSEKQPQDSENPAGEPGTESEQTQAGGSSSSENTSDEQSTSPDSSSGQSGREPEQGSPGETEESENEAGNGEEGDFPEYEPLTPELVEDEAVRGDFVLRWAVILLALLLGCTEIFESATLVHIKAGQYMASHGLLPPRTDVFSYTAADRTWINLSWLFDLSAAGVYAIGGAAALSFCKALLAALTVGFILHTSKPNVPTWWGSFCAGLALLVWYPQFTMRPEIITLLGLAITMWMLNRREEGNARHVWMLLPLFLLWSNLDPRMFLGLSLLALYSLGNYLDALWGRSVTGEASGDGQLWKVTGLCFAVSLLNPFGWHALLAPISQYGVEYGVYREGSQSIRTFDELQFLPLIDSSIWNLIGDSRMVSLYVLLGLLIMLFAAVTFVLNWERARLGHLLVYLGFVGYSIAGLHELASAVVVSCVIATLNGQDWYRNNFRQTYSVEFSELLFSRGGRAITVLFYFVIAYGTISGHLDGANGRRTGIGFHHQLQTTINGLQKDLEGSFDDRPFNFRLEQGDMLIWADQKVFIDSRVKLYYGEGEENLLDFHNKTRYALRLPISGQPLTNQPDVWKEAFDRYQVTHVVPRLAGFLPDYTTYVDLLKSPNWELTRLGTSTAVFYRSDLDDPQLKTYLEENRVDFVESAFRTESPQTEPRAVWPHAPSLYQKYLSLPQTSTSEDLWLAERYLFHSEQVRQGRMQLIPETFSFLYLAIRKANAVLENDPQSAPAYRILGLAYESLQEFEGAVSRRAGGFYDPQRRYFQAIQSYNQALTIDPQHLPTLRKLLQIYQNHNKVDLSLDLLNRIKELTDRASENPSEAERELLRRENNTRQALLSRIGEFEQQFQEARIQNASVVELANAAYQMGCIRHALEFLDEDPDTTAGNPGLQLFRALLLVEAGRVQEASESMERLEGIVDRIPSLQWRTQAALISLAKAQYSRAASLWTEEANQREDQLVGAMLDSLPFATPNPIFFRRSADLWPVQQTVITSNAVGQSGYNCASFFVESALSHLERGDHQTAENQFRKSLQISPDSPLRPLCILYLELITGESLDYEPPSQWIPVAPDMFAPENDSQQITPVAAKVPMQNQDRD